MPIVAFIGPSGSGKSTAVRRLAARHRLTLHPTWTTRPRRADERHGSPEHRFVSEREFDELARGGFFLDTIRLFGLPHRYGLPRIEPGAGGRVDAVMLRAPLVDRFAELVTRPIVYQIEDHPDRTATRLAARGTGADELAARLADNQVELRAGRVVADRVFVNDGTVEDLVAAISRALTLDVAVSTAVAS